MSDKTLAEIKAAIDEWRPIGAVQVAAHNRIINTFDDLLALCEKQQQEIAELRAKGEGRRLQRGVLMMSGRTIGKQAAAITAAMEKAQALARADERERIRMAVSSIIDALDDGSDVIDVFELSRCIDAACAPPPAAPKEATP